MAQDILIQAEDMGLSGDYTADFSKGYITLPGTTDDSSTGTAAAKFNGPDGTYDIIVSYFDEGDGKAQYQVDLNNSRIDAWTADLPGGASLPKPSNLTTRTISGISLKAGDTFSITGIENAGELGRVDAIQFVEAQSGGNQGGGLAGSNGVLEIMPLGDSITRGAEFKNGKISDRSKQNGYRDHLSALLKSDNIAFDFVGSQTNGEGSFDKNHEGHGGWTIGQLIDNIGNWLTTYQPEVILLNIGTNDLRSTSISVQGAIDKLGDLIDIITNRRPNAQLVVSTIGPTDPDDFGTRTEPIFEDRVNSYNSKIPGLVSNKAKEGRNVSFVNTAQALNPKTHIESDGYHPNDAGNRIIADVFYGAIVDSVNSRSSQNNISQNLSASNPITGTNQGETIDGTSEDESIFGKEGSDTLTGGGGADTFRYASSQDGLDYITDFGNDDRLLISAGGFQGGLEAGVQLATTTSASGTFVSGDTPISLGSSANFLFNTSTGLLQFDQDGANSTYGTVDIVQLAGVSSLSASQLEIIA